MDNASQFLDALFGQALEEKAGQILIWTAEPNKDGRKASQYFTSVDEAAKYAMKMRKKANVYFGLGLCPPGLKSTERADESQITGITCLWADIDFAGEGKKKKYPRDMDHVKQILKEVGLPESMLNFTGGGAQPFWLLNEPWIFKDAADREKAKELSRLWSMTIRSVCETHHCTIDSVFDLSRVLRVPHTFNLKHDPPREIVVHRSDLTARYGRDDFEALTIDEEFSRTNPATAFVVSGIEMPAEGVELPEVAVKLIKMDGRFERWWKRDRRDMADQSASSYDMIVANEGVYRGWTDQQIANAMFAWRAQHGEQPEKIHRRKYISQTIGLAKAGRGINNVAIKIEERAKEAAEAGTPVDEATKATPDERAMMLQGLGARLGCNVIKVIQAGRERSEYSLEVSGTPADNYDKKVTRIIPIGNSSIVKSFQKFWAVLYDYGLHPTYPMKLHPIMASDLRTVAETIMIEETSHYGETKVWLQRFCNQGEGGKAVIQEEAWESAYANRRAFIKDGKLHIDASSLRKHLKFHVAPNITDTHIANRLLMFGFKSVTVKATPKKIPWGVWAMSIQDALRECILFRTTIDETAPTE